MSGIFKPEDLARQRIPRLPGREPPTLPQPVQPSLQSLYQQILELREEVEKIKRALMKHGISLEEV